MATVPQCHICASFKLIRKARGNSPPVSLCRVGEDLGLRVPVPECAGIGAEMTREEFYAKLEKAEEEYRQGKYYEMAPGESLEAFLNRVQLLCNSLE